MNRQPVSAPPHGRGLRSGTSPCSPPTLVEKCLLTGRQCHDMGHGCGQSLDAVIGHGPRAEESSEAARDPAGCEGPTQDRSCSVPRSQHAALPAVGFSNRLLWSFQMELPASGSWAERPADGPCVVRLQVDRITGGAVYTAAASMLAMSQRSERHMGRMEVTNRATSAGTAPVGRKWSGSLGGSRRVPIGEARHVGRELA